MAVTTARILTPREFQVVRLEPHFPADGHGEGHITITPLPGRRSEAPILGHIVIDDGKQRVSYDIKLCRGKPRIMALTTPDAGGGSES